MAKCVFCGSDTQLYDAGIPTCLRCAAKMAADKMAAEEKEAEEKKPASVIHVPYKNKIA